MVHVAKTGVYFSGLHSRALLRLRPNMSISEVCSLPEGIHNTIPHRDGIIFNDTKSDVVRYLGQSGESVAFPVPSYREEDLEFNGVDSSKIARQSFGRGLCLVSDTLIAAGSSPSTISLYDFKKNERTAMVNLTMDIRNAIHGLEVWPFD